MDIGKNISKLRKRQNLSQEQLAEKIGVTRQTISNWELGESSPDIRQAKKLSKTFDISLDQLVTDAQKVYVDSSSRGYEYISKIKISGLPLVHINIGLGREIRIAKGIIAVGNVAKGIVALGGVALAKYVASGDYAYGYIAIGNHVKGVVELLQDEVTKSEIESIILQNFPKTWDIIIYLISNLTYR